MLFSKEFISKLGTKSLSRNPELTKERAAAAWDAAAKEKREEIYFLAGIGYAIAYRVRSVGAITTKMTIAYSQALNLDPYYLIGAKHENEGYTFESAKKLLIEECGLRKIVMEFEIENKEKETEPVQDAEKPAETTDEVKSDFSIAAAIQKLNEEDLLGLFKALIIKAGVGKPEAISDMTKITEILMK